MQQFCICSSTICNANAGRVLVTKIFIRGSLSGILVQRDAVTQIQHFDFTASFIATPECTIKNQTIGSTFDTDTWRLNIIRVASLSLKYISANIQLRETVPVIFVQKHMISKAVSIKILTVPDFYQDKQTEMLSMVLKVTG